MITRLALRSLAHRPWRSAMLLGGYALGVGVMIVLLAIGEALLTQARDERLIGGGSITVLPQGLDVEVMKTGGVGGLFFSIDRARFIYRQLLASPRLAPSISAVAPQIDGKLLYLRTRSGVELPVRATGEIPSRTRAAGAAAPVAAGRWGDDEADRSWMSPTPLELYGDIDHFHLPSAGLANRDSWAEWHYVNVLSKNGRQWAFISYIVAGDVPDGRWGGQLVITLREQGGRTRRFTTSASARDVRFSIGSADVRVGDASIVLRDDGRYALRGRAREEGGPATIAVDLVVSPDPRAYFPGASMGDCSTADRGRSDESCAFSSGYAVAALRAGATGTLCVERDCTYYEGAQAYHDHNWGVWRGVVWEWGESRAGSYTLLYGRVQPPDIATSDAAPLFLFLVDSLGFRALFRPRTISYTDARVIDVDGRSVKAPATAVITDTRGDDTIRVEIAIEDAIATDTRRRLIERGDASAARRLLTPYFIQMKGHSRLSGRVGGSSIRGEGAGFFETYR